MTPGLGTNGFTLFHVIISLAGIASGFVVAVGMISNKWPARWNLTFLATTIATSVTGFMFRSAAFGPPHVIGIISLVVLAVALFALYGGGLAGRWRLAYVVSAVLALYLNFFVAIVQAFQKMAVLHSLAPTQSEPPFLIAQVIAMCAFIAIGILCAKRFRPTLGSSIGPNLRTSGA